MPCGRDLLLTFKTSKAGKSHLHTPDIRQRESRPTLQSSYSAWGWEAECRDIQGLAGCWCAGTFDLCSPEQIKVDLLRSPQSRATFRVFMGVFELPLVWAEEWTEGLKNISRPSGAVSLNARLWSMVLSKTLMLSIALLSWGPWTLDRQSDGFQCKILHLSIPVSHYCNGVSTTSQMWNDRNHILTLKRSPQQLCLQCWRAKYTLKRC